MDHQQIARELSQFIRATRLHHGITQDEIEIKTNIPKEVLQSWEDGRSSPKGFQFFQWLQAFDKDSYLRATLILAELTNKKALL